MAQKVELEWEIFSCCLCLDLLRDPVTTSCGHSYCRKCINGHWEAEEEERRICSCPQCRRTFTARPALEKNTMLAALAEQLEKTGLKATPADECHAGAEDVACDVCTGRKLKALKSCLVCQASYCHAHLQPHRHAAPLKKHKLVEPTQQFQEDNCPRHDEVMKLFCRTDRQSICCFCSVDEHKGHDTVSAATERAGRQRELEETRQKIQQRIQHGEGELKVLQKEVEAIDSAADKEVKDSEEIFANELRLLEERHLMLQHKVRLRQESERNRVRELQKNLEQEISELGRRDVELEKISQTLNHSKFLHKLSSLWELSQPPNSSSLESRPQRRFEDVTTAVSKLRDKIQHVLMEKPTSTDPHTLPEREPEPRSRQDFLRYSREIILDPNTAHQRLMLSEGNRKVAHVEKDQDYSDHPDRFTDLLQVLSREDLTGRCYWEVKRGGRGVYVAVAYRSIGRAGRSKEYRFGFNDKSWCLYSSQSGHLFYHDGIMTDVAGPTSSRVGVYLDQEAGLLSFYGISGTMELLHRVKTTFAQPLRAGICVFNQSTAELCEL